MWRALREGFAAFRAFAREHPFESLAWTMLAFLLAELLKYLLGKFFFDPIVDPILQKIGGPQWAMALGPLVNSILALCLLSVGACAVWWRAQTVQPSGASRRYLRSKLERLREVVKAIRQCSSNCAAFGGAASGINFKILYDELEAAGDDFTVDPLIGHDVQHALHHASLILAVGDAQYLRAHGEGNQRMYLSQYDLELQKAALSILEKTKPHVIYSDDDAAPDERTQASARAILPMHAIDPGVRDALADLITRATALENYLASHHHAVTIFDASPAEQWEQDYALWEDSAVALLKRMGRAATADVLRNTRAPRRSIYSSATLVPIGVDQSQVNRLRGQREVVEIVLGECG
jgi:hypothetical protein